MITIEIGHQSFSTSVEMEQPNIELGINLIPRALLPLVEVMVDAERSLPKLLPTEFNIMEITLEAVYNPPEIWKTSCKAATWLPKEMPIEVKTVQEPLPTLEEMYEGIDRKGGLLDEFIRCVCDKKLNLLRKKIKFINY